MTRRILTALALAIIAAALSASPAAASVRPWMMESWSIGQLGPYQQAMRQTAYVIREPDSDPAQGRIVHYTRLSACPQRDLGVLMPCYGLAQHRPAPGSIAMYDNEGWTLTPADEHTDPCGSAATFASEVRADGAVPAIYLGAVDSYSDDAAIQCAASAAGDGGWFVIGQQDKEAHTASYLAELERIAGVAEAAQPGLTFSFGLSTRAKYDATAWRLARDYETVRAAHADWSCWLNAIPYDRSADKAVRMLRYLGGVR